MGEREAFREVIGYRRVVNEEEVRVERFRVSVSIWIMMWF